MRTDKIERHLESLKEAHTLIDKEISAKLKRGGYKDEEIEAMKKNKLRLKDQIEAESRRLRRLD